MEKTRFEQAIEGQFATAIWHEAELSKLFPEIFEASNVAAITSSVASEHHVANADVENMLENINLGIDYSNEEKADIYDARNFTGQKMDWTLKFYKRLVESLGTKSDDTNWESRVARAVDESATTSVIEIQQTTVLTREKKFWLISLVIDLGEAYKAEPSLHFATIRSDGALTQPEQ